VLQRNAAVTPQRDSESTEHVLSAMVFAGKSAWERQLHWLAYGERREYTVRDDDGSDEACPPTAGNETL
jgi:hypothetical protein